MAYTVNFFDRGFEFHNGTIFFPSDIISPSEKGKYVTWLKKNFKVNIKQCNETYWQNEKWKIINKISYAVLNHYQAMIMFNTKKISKKSRIIELHKFIDYHFQINLKICPNLELTNIFNTDTVRQLDKSSKEYIRMEAAFITKNMNIFWTELQNLTTDPAIQEHCSKELEAMQFQAERLQKELANSFDNLDINGWSLREELYDLLCFMRTHWVQLQSLHFSRDRERFTKSIKLISDIVVVVPRRPGPSVEEVRKLNRRFGELLLKLKPLSISEYVVLLNLQKEYYASCLNDDDLESIYDNVPRATFIRDEFFRNAQRARQNIPIEIRDTVKSIKPHKFICWSSEKSRHHDCYIFRNARGFLEVHALDSRLSIATKKEIVQQKMVENAQLEPALFKDVDRQVIINLGKGNTADGLTQRAKQLLIPSERYEFLSQVVPQNAFNNLKPNSLFYIVGHCDKGRSFISTDGETTSLSIPKLVDFLKTNPHLKHETAQKPLRVSLIACNSAIATPERKSFAEQLSVALDKENILAEVVGRNGVMNRGEVLPDRYKKGYQDVEPGTARKTVFVTVKGMTTKTEIV